MKVEIDYQELLKLVRDVSRVSDPKQENVYQCIFVEVLLGKIAFTATNLELYIKREAQAKVYEQGQVLINAKLFSQIIKRMNATTVMLEIVGQQLYITSDTGSKTALAILDHLGPFPTMKKELFTETSRIDGRIFYQMVQKVLFVGDTKEKNSEDISSSACLEIKDGTLQIQVLDSFRIAVRKEKISGSADVDIKIRLGNLREIAALIKNEKEVKVFIDKHYISLEFENVYIGCRLLDGAFFRAIEKMSPMIEKTSTFTLNRERLIDSIDRAMIFDNVAFFIDVKKEGIAKLYASAVNGNVEDQLPVTCTGEDIKICFNQRYGIQIFKALEDEDITIRYIDKKKPFFIVDDEGSYMYAILPINYQEV